MTGTRYKHVAPASHPAIQTGRSSHLIEFSYSSETIVRVIVMVMVIVREQVLSNAQYKPIEMRGKRMELS